MTRVLHTGDTHLGYQQYHLPARKQDFLDAFQQVTDDAIADEVDAVVHAGDLFHDRQPTLSDIMGALGVLRTLDDADIPFLAVVGNHESKRDRQWLDLFESMGLATRLSAEPVTIGDVAFYGLDYVPRSQREDLAYDFEPTDQPHAVLVSHGLFEPFDHGEWDARRILRESNVAFDALLLGDDHEPQTKQVDDPHEAWLTYCGSTERASASEREDRGYNLITFDDGVDIRRRGLDTRNFEFVDIELGPGEGTERVRERVAQHDLTDAVLIVTITGEGEEIMPAAIEEMAMDEGALVARVNDRRELADESGVDVTFADPDRAVRERITELGLSKAAHNLDETIRASKVPDSNVADTVESEVRELAADGDASVFEDAAEVTVADSSNEETLQAESGAKNESAKKDAVEDDEGIEEDDSVERNNTDSTTESASNGGADEATEKDGDADPDDEEDQSGDEGDAQASMEEYL
jgi:exonuclease SbcD